MGTVQQHHGGSGTGRHSDVCLIYIKHNYHNPCSIEAVDSAMGALPKTPVENHEMA